MLSVIRRVEKRSVQLQRRKVAGSRNPVKSLHLRTDLQDVYEEVNTAVVERELARGEAHKMKSRAGGQQSHLAVEALAGLASKEDFTSVALKSAQLATEQLPDTVYLVHIKGNVRGRGAWWRRVEKGGEWLER